MNSPNCFELLGSEYIHLNLRIPSPHIDPTFRNYSLVFYESEFVDVSLGDDEVPECAKGLPDWESDDFSLTKVLWRDTWALDDQVVLTSPTASSSCSSQDSFRKDLLSDSDSQLTSNASLDRSVYNTQKHSPLRETGSDFEIPAAVDIGYETGWNDVFQGDDHTDEASVCTDAEDPDAILNAILPVSSGGSGVWGGMLEACSPLQSSPKRHVVYSHPGLKWLPALIRPRSSPLTVNGVSRLDRVWGK